MWIDVKGLVARINAAVSVKLLAHRERSVLALSALICKIPYCQILETDVLGKKVKVSRKK